MHLTPEQCLFFISNFPKSHTVCTVVRKDLVVETLEILGLVEYSKIGERVALTRTGKFMMDKYHILFSNMPLTDKDEESVARQRIRILCLVYKGMIEGGYDHDPEFKEGNRKYKTRKFRAESAIVWEG